MFILALTFGFLAAAAALLAQVFLSTLVDISFTGSPTLFVLIMAATLEESAKFAFLIQLNRRLGNPLTLLHALFFGLGFIAAEFSLVLLSSATPFELSSIGAMVGIHLLSIFVIFTGFRLQETYRLNPLAGLGIAILLHALYNSTL
jgi:uncharacterized membrane protein YhfC